MRRQFIIVCAAAALGISAQSLDAQEGHDMHGGHASPTSSAESPSTAAFQAVNEKMHTDMAVDYTGDADVDFVRGMIPHHRGAIDMAKVVLEHGKDPEIRKLAEEVIEAQQREIAEMEAWLKAKGQ